MSCAIGIDVERAAAILRKGGLVAFPTETVYGLGGHALDAKVVARIFEVKDRPHFDPIIVHVPDVNRLKPLVSRFSAEARRLGEMFWPGPLTLVLPKSAAVPDLATSGLPTVAVRIPNHPMALELLEKSDLPLAAPSANLFGHLSPTRAEDVACQLGDKIDYILDGGPCGVGIESTVLQLDGLPCLLRPGGLPVEEIESAIGPVSISAGSARSPTQGRPSPGMLSRHYAPQTPLVIEAAFKSQSPTQRIGLLTLGPVEGTEQFAAVEVLSATGDLSEAAANFFAALRRLDEVQLDRIVAVPFPEEGLGRALNDRLRRAAWRD